MNKKFLYAFIGGTLGVMLLSSCVDDRYDLKKGVSTDVSIPGNTIAIPVGNLKAVQLDSLIDLEDIEILKKGDDGVYCISQKEEIEPIEETIDPISLSIDPINEELKIEFTEAEITSVHIDAEMIDPAKFETPTINLDELDDELPNVKSKVSQSITNPELEMLFSLQESGMLSPSDLPEKVDLSQVVDIENETVNCDFTYTLPDEIETIYTIQFGEDNTPGALVQVVVNHPSVLIDVDKKIDFEINFPENYKLSTYSKADEVEKYIISDQGNTVKVTDLKAEGYQTLVSFYVNEMVDVDKNITDGVISIKDQIVYNVHYKVDGSIVPTMEMSRSDFKFDVSLDMPLTFHDASGVTKDVEVDFEPVTMDFDGHFDNLQYIDSVKYVEFDEELSVIKLKASVDGDWMDYFHIKEGYSLKLKFPKELTICPIHSQYNGKGKEVIYDENEHAFYINDLSVLKSAEWDIALQKLELNVPVVNGECDMNIHAEVVSVDPDGVEHDYVLIAGEERKSMMTALNTLEGDKYANFSMDESDLVVKDAVVHTETIISTLDSHTEFSLNEEVPSEIGRIERVDFKEDVVVSLDMTIDGLEELNTDVELNLHAVLPSFLKIAPLPSSNSDINISVNGDSLIVKALYNPQEDKNLNVELACTKLDFLTEEFNGIGLVPQKSADGKAYLVYSGEILVEGEAAIRGMEFHSQVLDKTNEIVMNLNVAISDMEIKTFHGIYDAEIESVEESIALDLGEDLEFLKNEENTITLADPQIEIEIENSISIPVDMDLHLYCVDGNGSIIPTSNIHETIGIHPAEYNEEIGEIIPVKTKLFLTSSEDLEPMVGFEKVLIPELATLLAQIPDTIHINITPVINTSVTHHVDISKPLSFSASYAVNIPLKFDELNLCYKETISDINADLGEAMIEMSNVSLKAKMKITNTIPLGLALNVTPLDANGDVIDDIVIKAINIKPGLGGDILVDEQEAQEVEFEIDSRSGDLSILDKLDLSIAATSNHVTGSVGLKGSQGIKISDIVLILKGDIETEL